MANAGVASRRASERMILEGRVMVNGQVVTELGTKVDPTRDVIVVDGELIPAGVGKVYIVLNKPVGVISTAADRWGRKTVLDLVDVPGRVYPVGRLDADSEGLMLLTNDGEVTDRLTHPRFEHEKVYLALARGQPTDAALRSLVEGVVLEDGPARAVAVRRIAGAPRAARGMDLGAPAGATWLEITMREGRKRQIRRMLERVGHRVERLIRVRLGPLELGDLKPGESRSLTAAELKALRKSLRETRREGARSRRPPAARRRPAKPDAKRGKKRTR